MASGKGTKPNRTKLVRRQSRRYLVTVWWYYRQLIRFSKAWVLWAISASIVGATLQAGALMFLIWYANIPEEATYFALRFDMRWATLFWLVPALSFVVPFVVLMSAAAKRSRAAMFQVSLVVLLGRWVDEGARLD